VLGVDHVPPMKSAWCRCMHTSSTAPAKYQLLAITR
jgi:hypothetical protein